MADPQSRGRGRFVVFPYCISIVVMTFRRQSDPVFIPDGQSALVPSIPYLMISMLFGWWGFPFGLIWTPMSIITCLTGGTEVSRQS